MVSQNDYNLHLYNGDIGIALPDRENQGNLRVYFQISAGEVRSFMPARLPAHETVFAMTIHKSQGSEFYNVLMILPLEDSRILTRELLYTGITRARSHLELWGTLAGIRTTIARQVKRTSGLYEQLWRRG